MGQSLSVLAEIMTAAPPPIPGGVKSASPKGDQTFAQAIAHADQPTETHAAKATTKVTPAAKTALTAKTSTKGEITADKSEKTKGQAEQTADKAEKTPRQHDKTIATAEKASTKPDGGKSKVSVQTLSPESGPLSPQLLAQLTPLLGHVQAPSALPVAKPQLGSKQAEAPKLPPDAMTASKMMLGVHDHVVQATMAAAKPTQQDPVKPATTFADVQSALKTTPPSSKTVGIPIHEARTANQMPVPQPPAPKETEQTPKEMQQSQATPATSQGEPALKINKEMPQPSANQAQPTPKVNKEMPQPATTPAAIQEKPAVNKEIPQPLATTATIQGLPAQKVNSDPKTNGTPLAKAKVTPSMGKAPLTSVAIASQDSKQQTLNPDSQGKSGRSPGQPKATPLTTRPFSSQASPVSTSSPLAKMPALEPNSQTHVAAKPEATIATEPQATSSDKLTSETAEPAAKKIEVHPWELPQPLHQVAPPMARPLDQGTPTEEALPLKEAMKAPFTEAIKQPGKPAELRLQLSPENLGHMEIRVMAHEGTVSAEIRVDHPQAHDLLQAQLADLHQSLADQGIKIDKLEVNVGQDRRQGGQSSGMSSGSQMSGGFQQNTHQRSPQTPATFSSSRSLNFGPSSTDSHEEAPREGGRPIAAREAANIDFQA